MSRYLPTIVVAVAGLAATATTGEAAEGGSGFYLLGSKTTMAGYLPGPGVYFSDPNYLFMGSANAEIPTAGGDLEGSIDAKAAVTMPSFMWVMNDDVLGGNLAFSITEPLVYKHLSASAYLEGSKLGAIDEENFAPGDPVAGATIGWHTGNLHYSLGALVNIPVGQWNYGDPVNAGFNHWGLDTTAAATYLDPKTGIELSGGAGFTFNGENPDTNYQSGTEFHAEFATMLHVSQTFSLGLNGYLYRQVTGDSGQGATLGDFKGSVNAIGPALDYTLMLGTLPINTNLRYFHEFDEVNRVGGDVGYVTISVPISVAPKS